MFTFYKALAYGNNIKHCAFRHGIDCHAAVVIRLTAVALELGPGYDMIPPAPIRAAFEQIHWNIDYHIEHRSAPATPPKCHLLHLLHV